MTAFIARAVLSGLLIALIAMVAKRSPAAGALIASLPLVSILGMVWLWRDTGDADLIARHVEATFWYVIPSLPMFLVMPMLMRHGMGFWFALLIGCALTFGLYLVTILIAARFGVRM